MSANDSLPVILVSAADAAAASAFISDIIGEDEDEDGGEGGAVWRLRNKYYAARARLLPLPDGAAPPPDLRAQAHLILLAEHEGAQQARARAAAATGAVRRGGVRVAAARAAREAPALAAWACAAHYEPVALQAPAGEGGGVARVREALHAHVWPGLRRATACPSPSAPESDGSASSESSWGSWVGAGDGAGEEEEEEAAERRAAQLAEVLALLPARGAGGGGGGGEEEDAERRLRAEQLLAAACRALGLPAPGGNSETPG